VHGRGREERKKERKKERRGDCVKQGNKMRKIDFLLYLKTLLLFPFNT